ncbi:hypothetical protein HYX70_04120 [Candidatus Saccharibacteria bacterium]|nr:hypothetical protein [Candidatus Saccharibacteria bacterium]
MRKHSDNSLPWRKLGHGKFTYRTLQYQKEPRDRWRNTKANVIVAATNPDYQYRIGQIIYMRHNEVWKEAGFHPTTFDAWLRGAENADESIRKRSSELSGDAEILRSYSELLGVNWYAVKDDVAKRADMLAVLAGMSLRYAPAIRERLLQASAKVGASAALRDRHKPPRDNPSAMRWRWSAAIRRFDAQWEFNEKAAGSAADMILLARAVQVHVDELFDRLLEAEGTSDASAAVRSLVGAAIFNPLCNAGQFAKQHSRHGVVADEDIGLVISAYLAERQMCAASGLVTLIRDFPEFRTSQVFNELRQAVSWEPFDEGYSDLSLQLLAFTDALEVVVHNDAARRKSAKSIKKLIRGRVKVAA